MIEVYTGRTAAIKKEENVLGGIAPKTFLTNVFIASPVLEALLVICWWAWAATTRLLWVAKDLAFADLLPRVRCGAELALTRAC